jgi:hypothetical protein
MTIGDFILNVFYDMKRKNHMGIIHWKLLYYNLFLKVHFNSDIYSQLYFKNPWLLYFVYKSEPAFCGSDW